MQTNKEGKKMFKIMVKEYGSWVNFTKSNEDKELVIFETREDAEKVKRQRVGMFGPNYKIVEVK